MVNRKKKAKKTKKAKRKSQKAESILKPRKIKIKVVGIGGGGAFIVSEMAKSLKGVSFLAADTDSRVFKKTRRGVKVFQFGEKLLGGVGTGMDPEMAQKAAREERERIAKIFKDQDLSILVGALGGGVASGAGPVFTEEARAQKNVSLGIFTLPFRFEGEKKMRIAKHALQNLRENLSGIIVVPNEKIFQICDKKTPLKKALTSLNQIFLEWLEDLIEMISKPNLINIDFADLRTILKERGTKIFFSQGTAQGANRAEEVIKNLFQSPLYDSAPKNIKRILFNVAGGKDLALKELERVSEAISKLNPKAKIIFGVCQSPKYKRKIKITLLAVTGGEKKIAPAKTAPSKLLAGKKKKSSAKPKSSGSSSLSSADKEVSTRKKAGIRGGKTRRSALEIKKEEEEEEEKEWGKTPDWEIPAFLRRKVK